MKPSSEFASVLVMLGVVLMLSWVPMETTTRLMVVALVIVVGGGAMAFIRSRKATRR